MTLIHSRKLAFFLNAQHHFVLSIFYHHNTTRAEILFTKIIFKHYILFLPRNNTTTAANIISLNINNI